MSYHPRSLCRYPEFQASNVMIVITWSASVPDSNLNFLLPPTYGRQSARDLAGSEPDAEVTRGINERRKKFRTNVFESATIAS